MLNCCQARFRTFTCLFGIWRWIGLKVTGTAIGTSWFPNLGSHGSQWSASKLSFLSGSSWLHNLHCFPSQMVLICIYAPYIYIYIYIYIKVSNYQNWKNRGLNESWNNFRHLASRSKVKVIRKRRGCDSKFLPPCCPWPNRIQSASWWFRSQLFPAWKTSMAFSIHFPTWQHRRSIFPRLASKTDVQFTPIWNVRAFGRRSQGPRCMVQ